MELKEAIKSRRTKRKFNNKKVSHEKLTELIEYARYAPMGANLQGLKYAFIEEKSLVKEIFKYTKWSGYEPEKAPSEEEQPTGYIAILGDTQIKTNGSFEADAGAAGTIITLVAEDMGIATCWLGSVDRENVAKLMNLDKRYKLLYLIATGYSDQNAVAFDTDGDIKYYTDEKGVLNVPKRKTKDIIIA